MDTTAETVRRPWRPPSGPRLVGAIALVLSAALALCVPDGVAGAAVVSAPAATTSLYESSVRPPLLFHQGAVAGRAGAAGIVILDFGRPAERAGVDGTIDFAGQFVPLGDIAAAARSYVRGYFRYAPPATSLMVAIGTNNSCGAGQPCGTVRCGCLDEPGSYLLWGEQLAATVEATASFTTTLRADSGYSDNVRVVAADDIEPAFDPGYLNTYNLLDGYARTVGGSVPAMVDYGSADPHVWSEEQLYQVAYGFAPDVPMPEIYGGSQAGEWAALLRYAARRGHSMQIFGVLAGGASAEPPAAAYAELAGAIGTVGPQRPIPWLSTIGPLNAPVLVRQLGED